MLRRAALKLGITAPLTIAATRPAAAQEAPPSRRLRRRQEWFRDLKFGLFLHWGAYSQLGCIESWPLVWADRRWANPTVTTREELAAFRQRYFGLPATFDPQRFDPRAWARAARRAGMKYVMFTTKHHDGFAMFDTRLSDYRVTHRSVPFSRNRRANVATQIFSAFRAEGLAIGAYFSKADWHSPDYWHPDRFAEDRHVNYDTAADPERWQRFVRFTHGQIREVLTGYGKIDILWLDGNWMRPPREDLRLAELVATARRLQPDILVVDRGRREFEDYLTPEQEVLKQPLLDRPWESCMTMATQWSYRADDTYKSTRTLIHTLVDVVAKGGNLLLNLGPTPDGELPSPGLERLEQIGAWMAVNGEALHGTRPAPPYLSTEAAFTRKGATHYALVLDPARSRLELPAFQPPAGARAALLGSPAATLTWRSEGAGVVVDLPPRALDAAPGAPAVIRFARG
jgi:alpha-L-fucosidase